MDYWLNPYFAKMNIAKNRMQKTIIEENWRLYRYGLLMGQRVLCTMFTMRMGSWMLQCLKQSVYTTQICNLAVLLQIRPDPPCIVCQRGANVCETSIANLRATSEEERVSAWHGNGNNSPRLDISIFAYTFISYFF